MESHASVDGQGAGDSQDDARTEDFTKVETQERQCIIRRRAANGRQPPNAKDPLCGLALSGGGIRSASFAIGVMQALHKKGRLELFDYLSTVSGGGYTGGSYTWFMGNPQFFPFGESGQGVRSPQPGRPTNIVNHIRQRASYLNPGGGITSLSMVAVTLRTTLLTFAGYLSLLTLLFWAALSAHLFDRDYLHLSMLPRGLTILSALGLLAMLLLALAAIGYSLMTGIRILGAGRRYPMRRLYQEWAGVVLHVGLLLLFVGAIPWMIESIAQAIRTLLPSLLVATIGLSDEAATALSAKAGTVLADKTVLHPVLAAAVVALAPFAAKKALSSQQSAEPPKAGAALFITLGATCGVIGLLFLGFGWALAIVTDQCRWYYPAAFVVLGVVRNSNLFSLHRMYRDRLMEAFMPDRGVTPAKAYEPARTADQTKLHDVAPCGGKSEAACAACGGLGTPYPLINTNAVLAGSSDIRFRGREGDSFLLSPLWSGADSTGWVPTRHLMRGKAVGDMTLPTAVAISGAAVNAHSGSSPTALVRNPMIALLLTMFGIQLGYWVPNPAATCLRKALSYLPPNDIFPGLGALFGGGLHEKAAFIQLADGGHYENLGIYELIRRKVPYIVVSDASADPDFVFDDLGNAVERVRVDFGVQIRFLGTPNPLGKLLPESDKGKPMPDKFKLAEQGYAIADIIYPGQQEVGTLVYIKATLVDCLPADIYAYRSTDKTFPHQTTADQFFDEAQFEAYRELGYRLALAAV